MVALTLALPRVPLLRKEVPFHSHVLGMADASGGGDWWRWWCHVDRLDKAYWDWNDGRVWVELVASLLTSVGWF